MATTTVNGYTLNLEYNDPWVDIEIALLTAFANNMPPEGSSIVSDEHKHYRLYYSDGSAIAASADDSGVVSIGSDISFNPSGQVSLNSGNVAIGPATAQSLLHVEESTSGAASLQITNSTTGSTSSDGLIVGIDADEKGVINNQENTDLLLKTNGTLTATLQADGDLVIGSTVPATTYKLHVYGSDADIVAQSVDETHGSYLGLFKSAGSLPTHPTNKYPAIKTDYSVLFFGVNDKYTAYLQDNGTDKKDFGIRSSDGLSDVVLLSTNGDSFLNGGNVGIGTDDPDYKLHIEDDVNGSIRCLIRNNNSGSSAYTGFGAQSDSCQLYAYAFSSTKSGTAYGQSKADGTEISSFGSSKLLIGTQSASPLILGTNDTERMRITSGGDVGIGYTNPLAKLSIQVEDSDGASSGDGVLIRTAANNGLSLGGSDDGGGYAWLSVASTKPMVFQPHGGNVGIGTDSPNIKLEVAGSFAFRGGVVSVGAGGTSGSPTAMTITSTTTDVELTATADAQYYTFSGTAYNGQVVHVRNLTSYGRLYFTNTKGTASILSNGSASFRYYDTYWWGM